MDTGFINAVWIRKYCSEKIRDENERWDTTDKKDSWRNGSHVGYIRGLKELSDFIDTIERINPDLAEEV